MSNRRSILHDLTNANNNTTQLTQNTKLKPQYTIKPCLNVMDKIITSTFGAEHSENVNLLYQKDNFFAPTQDFLHFDHNNNGTNTNQTPLQVARDGNSPIEYGYGSNNEALSSQNQKSTHPTSNITLSNSTIQSSLTQPHSLQNSDTRELSTPMVNSFIPNNNLKLRIFVEQIHHVDLDTSLTNTMADITSSDNTTLQDTQSTLNNITTQVNTTPYTDHATTHSYPLITNTHHSTTNPHPITNPHHFITNPHHPITNPHKSTQVGNGSLDLSISMDKITENKSNLNSSQTMIPNNSLHQLTTHPTSLDSSQSTLNTILPLPINNQSFNTKKTSTPTKIIRYRFTAYKIDEPSPTTQNTNPVPSKSRNNDNNQKQTTSNNTTFNISKPTNEFKKPTRRSLSRRRSSIRGQKVPGQNTKSKEKNLNKETNNSKEVAVVQGRKNRHRRSLSDNGIEFDGVTGLAGIGDGYTGSKYSNNQATLGDGDGGMMELLNTTKKLPTGSKLTVDTNHQSFDSKNFALNVGNNNNIDTSKNIKKNSPKYVFSRRSIRTSTSKGSVSTRYRRRSIRRRTINNKKYRGLNDETKLNQSSINNDNDVKKGDNLADFVRFTKLQPNPALKQDKNVHNENIIHKKPQQGRLDNQLVPNIHPNHQQQSQTHHYQQKTQHYDKKSTPNKYYSTTTRRKSRHHYTISPIKSVAVKNITLQESIYRSFYENNDSDQNYIEKGPKNANFDQKGPNLSIKKEKFDQNRKTTPNKTTRPIIHYALNPTKVSSSNSYRTRVKPLTKHEFNKRRHWLLLSERNKKLLNMCGISFDLDTCEYISLVDGSVIKFNQDEENIDDLMKKKSLNNENCQDFVEQNRENVKNFVEQNRENVKNLTNFNNITNHQIDHITHLVHQPDINNNGDPIPTALIKHNHQGVGLIDIGECEEKRKTDLDLALSNLHKKLDNLASLGVSNVTPIKKVSNNAILSSGRGIIGTKMTTGKRFAFNPRDKDSVNRKYIPVNQLIKRTSILPSIISTHKNDKNDKSDKNGKNDKNDSKFAHHGVIKDVSSSDQDHNVGNDNYLMKNQPVDPSIDTLQLQICDGQINNNVIDIEKGGLLTSSSNDNDEEIAWRRLHLANLARLASRRSTLYQRSSFGTVDSTSKSRRSTRKSFGYKNYNNNIGNNDQYDSVDFNAIQFDTFDAQNNPLQHNDGVENNIVIDNINPIQQQRLINTDNQDHIGRTNYENSHVRPEENTDSSYNFIQMRRPNRRKAIIPTYDSPVIEKSTIDETLVNRDDGNWDSNLNEKLKELSTNGDSNLDEKLKQLGTNFMNNNTNLPIPLPHRKNSNRQSIYDVDNIITKRITNADDIDSLLQSMVAIQQGQVEKENKLIEARRRTVISTNHDKTGVNNGIDLNSKERLSEIDQNSHQEEGIQKNQNENENLFNSIENIFDQMVTYQPSLTSKSSKSPQKRWTPRPLRRQTQIFRVNRSSSSSSNDGNDAHNNQQTPSNGVKNDGPDHKSGVSPKKSPNAVNFDHFDTFDDHDQVPCGETSEYSVTNNDEYQQSLYSTCSDIVLVTGSVVGDNPIEHNNKYIPQRHHRNRQHNKSIINDQQYSKDDDVDVECSDAVLYSTNDLTNFLDKCQKFHHRLSLHYQQNQQYNTLQDDRNDDGLQEIEVQSQTAPGDLISGDADANVLNNDVTEEPMLSRTQLSISSQHSTTVDSISFDSGDDIDSKSNSSRARSISSISTISFSLPDIGSKLNETQTLIEQLRQITSQRVLGQNNKNIKETQTLIDQLKANMSLHKSKNTGFKVRRSQYGMKSRKSLMKIATVVNNSNNDACNNILDKIEHPNDGVVVDVDQDYHHQSNQAKQLQLTNDNKTTLHNVDTSKNYEDAESITSSAYTIFTIPTISSISSAWLDEPVCDKRRQYVRDNNHQDGEFCGVLSGHHSSMSSNGSDNDNIHKVGILGGNYHFGYDNFNSDYDEETSHYEMSTDADSKTNYDDGCPNKIDKKIRKNDQIQPKHVSKLTKPCMTDRINKVLRDVAGIDSEDGFSWYGEAIDDDDDDEELDYYHNNFDANNRITQNQTRPQDATDSYEISDIDQLYDQYDTDLNENIDSDNVDDDIVVQSLLSHPKSLIPIDLIKDYINFQGEDSVVEEQVHNNRDDVVDIDNKVTDLPTSQNNTLPQISQDNEYQNTPLRDRLSTNSMEPHDLYRILMKSLIEKTKNKRNDDNGARRSSNLLKNVKKVKSTRQTSDSGDISEESDLESCDEAVSDDQPHNQHSMVGDFPSLNHTPSGLSTQNDTQKMTLITIAELDIEYKLDNSTQKALKILNSCDSSVLSQNDLNTIIQNQNHPNDLSFEVILAEQPIRHSVGLNSVLEETTNTKDNAIQELPPIPSSTHRSTLNDVDQAVSQCGTDKTGSQSTETRDIVHTDQDTASYGTDLTQNDVVLIDIDQVYLNGVDELSPFVDANCEGESQNHYHNPLNETISISNYPQINYFETPRKYIKNHFNGNNEMTPFSQKTLYTQQHTPKSLNFSPQRLYTTSNSQHTTPLSNKTINVSKRLQLLNNQSAVGGKDDVETADGDDNDASLNTTITENTAELFMIQNEVQTLINRYVLSTVKPKRNKNTKGIDQKNHLDKSNYLSQSVSKPYHISHFSNYNDERNDDFELFSLDDGENYNEIDSDEEGFIEGISTHHCNYGRSKKYGQEKAWLRVTDSSLVNGKPKIAISGQNDDVLSNEVGDGSNLNESSQEDDSSSEENIDFVIPRCNIDYHALIDDNDTSNGQGQIKNHNGSGYGHDDSVNDQFVDEKLSDVISDVGSIHVTYKKLDPNDQIQGKTDNSSVNHTLNTSNLLDVSVVISDNDSNHYYLTTMRSQDYNQHNNRVSIDNINEDENEDSKDTSNITVESDGIKFKLNATHFDLGDRSINTTTSREEDTKSELTQDLKNHFTQSDLITPIKTRRSLLAETFNTPMSALPNHPHENLQIIEKLNMDDYFNNFNTYNTYNDQEWVDQYHSYSYSRTNNRNSKDRATIYFTPQHHNTTTDASNQAIDVKYQQSDDINTSIDHESKFSIDSTICYENGNETIANDNDGDGDDDNPMPIFSFKWLQDENNELFGTHDLTTEPLDYLSNRKVQSINQADFDDILLQTQRLRDTIRSTNQSKSNKMLFSPTKLNRAIDLFFTDDVEDVEQDDEYDDDYCTLKINQNTTTPIKSPLVSSKDPIWLQSPQFHNTSHKISKSAQMGSFSPFSPAKNNQHNSPLHRFYRLLEKVEAENQYNSLHYLSEQVSVYNDVIMVNMIKYKLTLVLKVLLKRKNMTKKCKDLD